MKKLALILISVILVFGLSACGGNDISDGRQDSVESTVSSVLEEDTGKSDTEVISEPDDTRKTESGKILIAYFSVPEDVDINDVDAIAGASVVVRDGEKMGNTEYVARLIQEKVGGDLFRIETVDEYPLEHAPLVDQAAEEQDANLRPELATHVENFEQYEYVFLGYPNWWGDMPQPLYTFLEEYDFGAKTIIPFITHGGSGASRTVDTISQLQPGAVLMGNELVLSRNNVADSEETVVAWAEGLGLNAKTELPMEGAGSTVLSATADAKNQQTLYLWEEGNFAYGTRDPFVSEFESCIESLEEAGVSVETNVLDGRPHGFGYREGWIPDYDRSI